MYICTPTPWLTLLLVLGKMRVSEIRVKRIRVNQGLGVVGNEKSRKMTRKAF